VSAQFVSLQGLEVPYYVCMFGAGVLKFVSGADAARTAPEGSCPGWMAAHGTITVVATSPAHTPCNDWTSLQRLPTI
jgi:hypothetical protein